MYRWCGAAFGLLVAWSIVAAQEKQAPQPKPGSFAALAKELRDADADAMTRLRTALNETNQAKAKLNEAKTDEEKAAAEESVKKAQEKATAAQREFLAGNTKNPNRVLEYVDKNPNADDVLDAYIWLLQMNAPQAAKNRAVEGLGKANLDDPRLANVAGTLSRNYSPATTKLLRSMVGQSKNKAVQASAALALGQNLKNRAGIAQGLKDKSAAEIKSYESFYGVDAIHEMQSTDPAQYVAEAEKLLDRVVKEFPTEKGPRDLLAKSAKAELFEMRNLAIGKAVPDIEQEDMDGVKFKLSDYRGKVVVIDFWGHW